jgi:multimeric flavodoxin WrbA
MSLAPHPHTHSSAAEEDTPVKVVAFVGSARKDANTTALVRHVFSELEAAGADCELIELAGKRIHGCTACMKCAEEKTGNCVGVRDFVSEVCIPKALAADAIIIASPVYFADVSTETKALIDRLGYASGQGEKRLARKIGAGVIAVRRAGAIHAFDTINHLFLISEMIVVGSSYWNIGIGRAPGEVEEDAEGIRTMHTLGKNMAWALERLRD